MRRSLVLGCAAQGLRAGPREVCRAWAPEGLQPRTSQSPSEGARVPVPAEAVASSRTGRAERGLPVPARAHRRAHTLTHSLTHTHTHTHTPLHGGRRQGAASIGSGTGDAQRLGPERAQARPHTKHTCLGTGDKAQAGKGLGCSPTARPGRRRPRETAPRPGSGR